MTNTSPIRIERISSARELTSLRGAWNGLTEGVPFRSFDWLESWWRAYGAEPRKELFALAAFDRRGDLVGLAPWYLEQLASQRRVIRFLGSGEVCSDYLTILCRQECEDEVTLALADWLCTAPQSTAGQGDHWDLLVLGSVDRDDAVVARLLEHLSARGTVVHRRDRSSCWRVNLPPQWEAYLAILSKSHRKQIRRLERAYFQTNRALVRVAATVADLQGGLEWLVGLHQRRRESLGDRGCFVSNRFAAFHEETARRLLDSGNLRLVWLELDGRTVAAEYQVLGDGIVYAYQSGIEPAALAHEPGRLITLATLKLAISEGRRGFDFLRGDELYKAHWRARPRPMQDVRVVSNSPGARLRHNLWLAGDSVKDWLKNNLRFSGVPLR